MQLLIEIRDDKAEFVLELLKQFPFVSTRSLNASMVAEPKVEYLTRTEEEIAQGLSEAIQEVALHKQEKAQLISLNDLLGEL